VAFAVGTVLAESGDDEYRWTRRFIGYGVAGATAYARVHGNVHWFSDVVAGGAIGMASARFVINRDAERAGTRHSAISVVPLDRGVMLTWYLVPAP
jgi:membrane-associated phospholipid phosphatase